MYLGVIFQTLINNFGKPDQKVAINRNSKISLRCLI